jgi:hypothetical protein
VRGYLLITQKYFMEKIIQYFDQPCKIACDEKCAKAWGISTRPSVSLSENPDDIVWLSDGELGDAPINPGTYEGGHAKPTGPAQIPNKWCVRECERCAMSRPGESEKPLTPKDWTNRVYNIVR